MLSVCVGFALYAMRSFTPEQCTTALHLLDGLSCKAVAVYWDESFGSDNACVERFLQRVTDIEIFLQPIHTRCHDNKKLRKHKREVYNLARAYPEVKFIAGVGLEDYCTRKAFTAQAKYLSRSKPANVRLNRNSCFSPAWRPDGVSYLEGHDIRPFTFTGNRGIGSNDGWTLLLPGLPVLPDSVALKDIEAQIRQSRGLRYYFIWYGAPQRLFRPSDRQLPFTKRPPLMIRRDHVRRLNRVARRFNT